MEQIKQKKIFLYVELQTEQTPKFYQHKLNKTYKKKHAHTKYA